MTDIRELFDDAVADAPPSRLSAHEVFRTGRARPPAADRARRGLAGTGVAVLLAGVFALPGTRGPEVFGPAARGSYWAGMADRDHLFMIRNRCPNQYPEPSGQTATSCSRPTDGGGTWESRGPLEERSRLPEVIDQETLVVWYPGARPVRLAAHRSDQHRRWPYVA